MPEEPKVDLERYMSDDEDFVIWDEEGYPLDPITGERLEDRPPEIPGADT